MNLPLDKTSPEPAESSDGQAIDTNEARFLAVITSNADGMIVVGDDGVILFANPAAETLLGRSRATLVGTELGRPIIPGETVEIDVFRAGREPRIAEMRVVETTWNNRPAALASFRDVTERKRLEDELNRRVAELAEADQQKNTFLAMLAHELRNPLAPVRNAAEVLRLKPHDQPTLEWARTLIEQQVTHMTRLVDDLLDVSRITRGTIQLRKVPIRLSEVIRHSLDAMSFTFESRRMTLHVENQDDTIVVDADPTRLEQIFTNLLNNAAKFSEDGGRIELSVRSEGAFARIEVKDHGLGISHEMLNRIFDLFSQAEATLDRSRGGLGIGLTLVRNLAEMHDGTVVAESDGRGQGSRFIVRLPNLERVPVPTTETGNQPTTASRQVRVLIVDDNLHAAESLGMLVKLWGHEAHQASDGIEAVTAAKAYHPEIILLDIGLPGMDGYEVARTLRSDPLYRKVRIVAMTGYGQESDRLKARDAGFDHHMVKPVDLDELRQILASPGEPDPTRMETQDNKPNLSD